MFSKMNVTNVDRQVTHNGTCSTGRRGEAGAQRVSALASSILPMNPLIATLSA